MRNIWLISLLPALTHALDVPKTFHNYAQAGYDTRQQTYDTSLQNVPPASISYVPVQASVMDSQPLAQMPPQNPPPLLQPDDVTPPPRQGPQPNGHMLAMQSGGSSPSLSSSSSTYPQTQIQPQAMDYTSQQFPAPLASNMHNVAPLTQIGQTGPQGMISSGAVLGSAELEQQMELQRQQQAQADAERARAALEAQRAKIEAKQRQMETERRKQEEEAAAQRDAYLRRQQEEQQRLYHQQILQQQQQQYLHTLPPNPNAPSDQNNPLAQLSNQQLEEYALKLREQIEKETNPGQGHTLPVQTMATTAPPVTQPLVVKEVTTVIPQVDGFGQPPDQSQPQPLPPPPSFPGFPSIPPKLTHDVNYCDRAQFDDTQLADLHLKRADYFIYNTSCSGLFFQCAIGQTFVLRCPSEQAQAFDPAISSCNFKNSVRFCPEYDHVMYCTIRETCTENEFACCALPQKCIEYTRRCDGHRDCSDGEDENNCPSCAKDEFACVKSGICIPATKRCDGKPDDCGDGTNMDEIGCSKNETCWGKFVCDSPATIAQAGHSVCLDYEKHCDGVKDCPDGEDEMNCKLNDAKYLSCENQKQQVRREQWCDGRENCADGSDEKYCF